MTSDAQKSYRNSLIKLIQVGRRDLRLDEPTYRDILRAWGGTESLSAMSIDGMKKVLDYFKSQGFTVRKLSGVRKQATDKRAKKVRALWLFLHELGAVRDPSEAALTAYVQRIAKVDHLHWARGWRRDLPEARERTELLIETLKKWVMRFLPGAIATLHGQIMKLHLHNSLSPEQIEEINKAGSYAHSDAGFDLHWAAWQRLMDALGRPVPLAIRTDAAEGRR